METEFNNVDHQVRPPLPFKIIIDIVHVFMVAQAHHDFITSTISVYMILNSKEGLTVGIVLCSVHYEQVNTIC